MTDDATPATLRWARDGFAEPHVSAMMPLRYLDGSAGVPDVGTALTMAHASLVDQLPRRGLELHGKGKAFVLVLDDEQIAHMCPPMPPGMTPTSLLCLAWPVRELPAAPTGQYL